MPSRRTIAPFSLLPSLCAPIHLRLSSLLAGALAGVAATLGCHPLDTVKVVVQASPLDRGTIAALRHVLDARGVLGLYAGMLPKLLSSAPCSAIYAATYESVKSSLLPLLPPPHAWVAHRAGGAAASIATSVVFTPLECIKARLQVGQYMSAPEAVVGIARSEGLGALYRGQEAVLWR